MDANLGVCGRSRYSIKDRRSGQKKCKERKNHFIVFATIRRFLKFGHEIRANMNDNCADTESEETIDISKYWKAMRAQFHPFAERWVPINRYSVINGKYHHSLYRGQCLKALASCEGWPKLQFRLHHRRLMQRNTGGPRNRRCGLSHLPGHGSLLVLNATRYYHVH